MDDSMETLERLECMKRKQRQLQPPRLHCCWQQLMDACYDAKDVDCWCHLEAAAVAALHPNTCTNRHALENLQYLNEDHCCCLEVSRVAAHVEQLTARKQAFYFPHFVFRNDCWSLERNSCCCALMLVKQIVFELMQSFLVQFVELFLWAKLLWTFVVNVLPLCGGVGGGRGVKLMMMLMECYYVLQMHLLLMLA